MFAGIPYLKLTANVLKIGLLPQNESSLPTITRWWFQIFIIFTLTWGDDPIWRAYFSDGWFNHRLDRFLGASLVFGKCIDFFHGYLSLVDGFGTSTQCFIRCGRECNLSSVFKRPPGCLFDVGDDNPTQLYGDYFINHARRIPINQPGFNGMSRFVCSCLYWEGSISSMPQDALSISLPGRSRPHRWQRRFCWVRSGKNCWFCHRF